MIPARDALVRLQSGNARFVAGTRAGSGSVHRERRDELVGGQAPFAVVLGCSDSRVPAELVFDQGLGDLFVIRVAGNIVAPSQIASVEFAVERLGSRLVVVMGHSRCGAVQATLEEGGRSTDEELPHLWSITDRIRPAIRAVLEDPAPVDPELRLQQAVRANILASAGHLRHGSPLLEQRIREDDVLVVGAEYSLDSGVVDFFDGLPRTRAES